MVCRNCEKTYENGVLFCRECGAPLVPMPAEQKSLQNPAAPAAQGTPTQAVSVGEWVLILLMPLIPCVGWLVWLVMMFVWGFGDNVKPSKKNYARASLIIALVALVLILAFVLISAVAGVTISHLVEELPYSYDYRYYY